MVGGIGGRTGVTGGSGHKDARVVVIQDHGGAFFRACATGNTLVQIDITGLLTNLDLEMPFFAVDLFKLGIGEKIDIQVPADLDQLG